MALLRLLAIALALLASQAHAQDWTPPPYPLAPNRQMSPTAALSKLPDGVAPPKIDGRINDAAWEHATALGPLTQQSPREGAEPTHPTDVRVLFDDKFFYVSVRAWDPEPEKLIAKVMRRDTSQRPDDRILVTIDTFHDKRNGYMFSTNPNSARYEGIIENNQPPKIEWDGIWYAKARVDAEGWTCEFAFPFQTLAFDPKKTSWGFNVMRSVRRLNEESRWASWRQNKFPPDMSEAGTLTGIEGDVGGLGLDIVPGGAIGGFRERERDSLTGDVHHRYYSTLDPTLDVFYKLTPSVTGALTFNTDFSDAEVDSRQVNLDRFALFFPETRDFFLQDAGIFDFGGLGEQINFLEVSNPNGMPFFTRKLGIYSDPLGVADGAILDIRGGAKATGRVGRLNFGVLDTQLEHFDLWCEPDPNDTDPSDGTDPVNCGEGRTPTRTIHRDIGRKNLSVARAKMNVGSESTLGFIATHGDPNSPGSGTTVGGDFRLRSHSLVGNGNNIELMGFALHTHTPGVSGDDDAYGLRFRYPNDIWFFDVSWAHIGAEYDPKLGFINRPGVEQFSFNGRKRWRPASGRVRFYDAYLDAQLVQNTDGKLETLLISPTFIEIHNALDDFIYFAAEARSEVLFAPFTIAPGIVIPSHVNGRRYDWGRGLVGIGMAQSRPLALYFEYSYGGFFGGTLHSIKGNLEWRASKHFFGQIEYVENKADLPAVFADLMTCAGAACRGDFTQRLVRLRAQYIFNPNLSWDSFVQYDNLTDSVGWNSRVRWIIQPGQDFTFTWNQGVDVAGHDFRFVSTGLTGKLAWTLRF